MLVNLENQKQYLFRFFFTKSPTKIVCLASSFMSFWAELQDGGNVKVLEDGAEVLKATALLSIPRCRKMVVQVGLFLADTEVLLASFLSSADSPLACVTSP